MDAKNSDRSSQIPDMKDNMNEKSSTRSQEEDEPDDAPPASVPPPHPVDTGWAWVVLCASSCMLFMVVGILKSFGMFFIEFLKEFGGSVSSASILTTIQTISYSCVAVPVLLYGVKRFDVRKVILMGTFAMSVGYGLSSFATSLQYLYFSQSVMIGSGMACVFGPNLINIGKYFNKRRGLANGIVFGAHSLGGFAFPYLLRFLFDKYGLRGALLITSGLSFHTMVFAALLRPADNYKPRRKINKYPEEDLHNDQTESLLNKTRIQNGINGALQDTTALSNSQPILPSENSATSRFDILRKRTISYSPEHERTLAKAKDNYVSESSISRYLSNGDIISLSLTDVGILQDQMDNQDKNSEVSNFNGRKSEISSCLDVIGFNLLKNVAVSMYLAVHLLGGVCNAFGVIFIPTYAKDSGISDQEVATLISVLSLADFAGRLLVGYLADKPWIRKQTLILISQVVLAIVLALNQIYSTFWSFLIFAGIFGIVAGTQIALYSPMLIDLAGMENFPKAMTIFLVAGSAFMGAVAPLLGYLKDLTGTYHATLYFMGGCAFVSALILAIYELFIFPRQQKSQKSDEPRTEV